MRPALLLSVLPALAFALACGGFGEPPPPVNPDASDPAEQARLAGDYPFAERMLKQRLAENASDGRAWRLLGDVNLSRGQDYPQRWKENLRWAIDAYVEATRVNPSDCGAWSRLALAVASAYENDDTRVSPELLASVPIKRGQRQCEGHAALVEIAWKREPDAVSFGALRDRLGWSTPSYQVLLEAQPAVKETLAVEKLSGLSWKEPLAETKVTPGGPFVVLEATTARGVDGAVSRPADIEVITVGSISGGNLLFKDRKLPAKRPDTGVVKAVACGVTNWTLDGPDKYPVGRCRPGPAARSQSSAYDTTVLKATGPSHYAQPTIAKAAIPWDALIDGSVQCTGGAVGRLLIDVPTCPVKFDRAIYQTRQVPLSSGVPGVDLAHADRIFTARGLHSVYGEDVARHLARGDVAAGLPYSLLLLTQSDLRGCIGRGLFQKIELQGDQTKIECSFGGRSFTLVDLRVTKVVDG